MKQLMCCFDVGSAETSDKVTRYASKSHRIFVLVPNVKPLRHVFKEKYLNYE